MMNDIRQFIIHNSSFAITLQTYLTQHAITARLIGEIGETPTVPAAAAALGVPSEHIIKTLLFEVTQHQTATHVVVISYGEKRVDKKLLGAALGVSKKHITFANAETVLELVGYPAGGVPPFGHRTPLPVLFDAGIVQHVLAGRDPNTVQIYAGGGDDLTMLEISIGELLRVLEMEASQHAKPLKIVALS